MIYNKYTLKELATIRYGKNQKNVVSSDGSFPIYGTGGLMGYASKYLYDKPSVLIGRKGTIDKVRYVTHPFWTVDTLFYTEINDAIVIPHFLYYVLSLLDLRKYNEGTSIPSLRTETLNRLELYIPPLSEQKKILSFIEPIEEKIDINSRINRNLLEQAFSMVNEWEVNEQDHIGYEKVEDVAELNPESYSSKDDWGFVNYLDTSSITEGTISEFTYIVPSEEKLPSRAKRKLKCKDIVYSTVRPNQKHYGFIREPVKNMLASTGFVVVRAKSSRVCSELLYLLITRDLVTEKMQQIAEGSTSTFPSIKPSDLGAYEIPVPQTSCNMKLIEGLSSIFECIHANQKENQELVELRDSLLPKFMSGELDVSNLDI